jgi:lipid-A-disaccharide synthase-like uncharacterized protein
MPPHEKNLIFVSIGFAGNAFFFLRFAVQWIESERAGRSLMPRSFWYLSVAGALLESVYAVYLAYAFNWLEAMPVILGTAPNSLVYVRNIMLIHKERKTLAAQGSADRPRPVGPGSPQDLEAARR